MVLALAARVRLTTRHSAVWRECARCGALAPLSPDEDRCQSCRPSTRSRRRPAPQRPSGRTRYA